VYAQFHLLSDQGEKNQTDPEKALHESPDLMQKDLVEAIDRQDYPSWTMSVQLMTRKQAEEAWATKGINVFDLTHIWPHKEYPLRKIGKVTLNQNPKVSSLCSTGVRLTPELLLRGRAGGIQPIPHGAGDRAVRGPRAAVASLLVPGHAPPPPRHQLPAAAR
jgi:hypothetical protein